MFVYLFVSNIEETNMNTGTTSTTLTNMVLLKQSILGENIMAEVDTMQLSQEHGAIRHDVAVESARLGSLIGSESCAINKHIGDVRQEDAENFGHTRRDIMAAEGNIRREVAQEAHHLSKQIGEGFCDTDSKVLETSSNVRREGSEHTNEIIKEGLKGDFNTRGDIKDTRYDLSTRITNGNDRVADRLHDHDHRVSDRFFAVGRDLSDLRQGQVTLAKDVELQALRVQLDAKENTKYLSDKISSDGEKTRDLINNLKYHDLSRGLVERNTELVNCEQDRRHYHDRWYDGRFDQIQSGFQGQWAQLQSQIQAFQSQLQETRQGMVNFGTMAGNAGQQSSTSNNVR